MTSETQDLYDQIPLYINGSLSNKQNAHFKQQLKVDPELSQEYEILKSLQDDFSAHDSITENKSHFLFNQIEQNISSAEKNSSLFDAFKSWFYIPQIAWGAAAIQFALLVVIFANNPQQPSTQTYQTLSTVNTASTETRINIIFKSSVTQKQLINLLTPLQISIINGPSEIGLYVLAVNKNKQDEIFGILEQSDKVEFISLKN